MVVVLMVRKGLKALRDDVVVTFGDLWLIYEGEGQVNSN